MKSRSNMFRILSGCLIGSLCGWSVVMAAEPPKDADTSHNRSVEAASTNAHSEAEDRESVVVEKLEVDAPAWGEATAWLGLSTSEASEALTAQLGLEPGVGLVVDYVETNSPAAGAGLQKNDLLVRFGSHWLSHPAQLRRLVHTRKQGDRVELSFYRKGQEQSATVNLASAEDAKPHLPYGPLLRDLDLHGPMREGMKALQESLGNLKIDQEKVQREIRRSLEQARESMRQGLKQMTNTDPATKALKEALRSLAGPGLLAENDASVVVRSTANNTKTVVKTDERGTLVLINVPKLRLTAHDTEGNLIFDGPIETEEERAKLPADLWTRVEPLLQKLK